jgi:DNA-binding CsgD family transcriptional regulator
VLVGRTDELRRLDDRVTDVVEGSGGALLVLGEPGAGVTSVLDAVARRASKRARVVRARAYAGSADGALLHDLARATDAASDSVDSLVDAFRSGCADMPLLLTVDDANRADRGSLDALAEVVARSPGLLAIVGWQMLLDAVPPALAGWDRLALAPLDTEASLAVARAGLGHDAAALGALVDRLHGNPRALRDVPPRLATAVLDGREPLPLELPVPESLLDAWSGALPEVGSGLDDALLLTALCQPAPPAAGAGALPHDALSLAATCPLVAVGIVPGEVSWVSAWVRDVVVARSRPAARRRAHAALASSAAELGAAPSVVAHHLGESVSGTDDEVADALEAQALRAERLGLPDVVSTTWATAALRTGDPSRRVERAVAGARCLTATGPGMNAVDDLLRVLEDADLRPDQVAVRDRLRALKRAVLDPDARVAAMLASVEQARELAPALLPDLLWELSVMAGQHGDAAVGVGAAEEYRLLEAAHAPGCGPPWTGTALLSAALFQSGDIGSSERLRRAAHEAADSLDPSTAELDLLFNAVALDDLLLDLSSQASERLLQLLQRLAGEAYSVACLYGIQGWRARARGDLVTARRMMRNGLDVAVPSSAVDVMCGLSALGAELSAIQGDDELERSAAGMRDLMQRAGDRRRLSTLDRALGLQALVGGKLDEAVVHLTAAADTPMLGRGLRDGALMSRVDLVEALVRSADEGAAARRGSSVLEVLDRMDDPLAAALAARVRGLLAGDDDEAVRLLGDALVHHACAVDPFERARSHLLRGERLRRLRRRGEARLDLLEAARLFEHLGAAPWLARAQTELRASGGGARLSGPLPDGPGLTAQELAVARVAALGASNREVAEALYISPRTVEYHLGNVYRKLGVHGRGALGARLLDDDEQG